MGHPARDRFRDRERNAIDHGDKLALDELHLFRKDVGTFIRQYDFLSQIVNYEDPSLEKLSIYLRHLAPVISSEQPNHEIDLSTVDFDFLTQLKRETTSGKLTGDVPLQPAKESGTGSLSVMGWLWSCSPISICTQSISPVNRLPVGP